MDYEFPADAGFVCDKYSVSAAGMRTKFYRVLCCTRRWNGSTLLGCSAVLDIGMVLLRPDALLYSAVEWLYSARMLYSTRH